MVKRAALWITAVLTTYVFSLAFYTIYFTPLIVSGVVLFGISPEVFAFTLIGFSVVAIGNFLDLVKKGKVSEIDRSIKSIGFKVIFIAATTANYSTFIIAVILGHLSYSFIGNWALLLPVIWFKAETYLVKFNFYLSPSFIATKFIIEKLTKKEPPKVRVDLAPYLFEKVRLAN